MKRSGDFALNDFRFVAAGLLLAWVMRPALAQNQPYVEGIVDDWTTHNVIFSNPGTEEEAIKNGKLGEWLNIVNDVRYRMQQARRYGPFVGSTVTDAITPVAREPETSRSTPAQPAAESPSLPEATWQIHPSCPIRWGRRCPVLHPREAIHADWSVQIAGGAGLTALNVYPAKYTFSPIASPSCTNDFVVFPTGVAGNSTQAASLFGFNNLYVGTCTSAPTTMFAYFVGTGTIQTSPVLSLDGTKVAFVESVTNGSIFHVLTMDKRGNSGCPNSSPCNGTSFNGPPAAPCIVNGTMSCSTNNAVDTKITMSGGVSNTRSAPYVDYSGDIAYVGDDTGKLHKFTGVFNGTPTEVTTGNWPVIVKASVILTSPVFDQGTSQNIFAGGSDGLLYCVTKAGTKCATQSIAVRSTGSAPVISSPILDSTNQTVFAVADSATNAVLVQTTTSLAAPVAVSVGAGGNDFYDGAFDNAYLTSTSPNLNNGHMYVCGNAMSAATPTLWRVLFNGTGTMTAVDTGSFQLVATGFAGPSVDCSPLTEYYNSNQKIDYLFLSVKNHGFSTGTPNCSNQTCLMSFVLPQTAPFAFPTGARSTFTSNLGVDGASAPIIDNASGTSGASQIYFVNLQVNSAVQASQTALQ